MADFFQTVLLLSICSSLKTHEFREDGGKSPREVENEKEFVIMTREFTGEKSSPMNLDSVKHNFHRKRRDANRTVLPIVGHNGTGLIKKKRRYKKRNTTHLIGKMKRRPKNMTREQLDRMNEKIRAYWRRRMALGITRRFPNRTRKWPSEEKKREVADKIRRAWAKRKEKVGTKLFKEHGKRMRKIWKRLREEEGRTDLFRAQTRNLRSYWNNLRETGRTDVIRELHERQSRWMRNYWQTHSQDPRLRDMSVRMREFWRRRKKEERQAQRQRLIRSCMKRLERNARLSGPKRKRIVDLFTLMVQEFEGLERRQEHALFMKGLWGDKMEEWGAKCPLGDLSERLSLFWTPDKRAEMSDQFSEYWRREREYYANRSLYYA